MNFQFSSFPELCTERLRLRDYIEEDYSTVLFLRSDPKMIQFIKRDPPRNLKEAVEFVDKVHLGYKNKVNINWVLSLKNDHAMIGSVCLWNFSENGKIGELGYDLHPHHQKQGYMLEAVRSVLEFGFNVLELERIMAYTDKSNLKSLSLLKKNQFVISENETDPDNENNVILSLSKKVFMTSGSGSE